MPEFRLVATVTVSAYTTVIAGSLEEAIIAVENRSVEAGGGPYARGEYWLVDELDESPQGIELDCE